jgi:hypothetical protein
MHCGAGRHDCKELLYAAPDGNIMSVGVDSCVSGFRSGRPKAHFKVSGDPKSVSTVTKPAALPTKCLTRFQP